MSQYTISRSQFVVKGNPIFGGQGTIHFTSRQLKSPFAELVYKEYLPHIRGDLDFSILESMISYLHSLNYHDAAHLLSICAWPCFMVEESGQVIGMLMPKAPDEFYFDLKLPSGKTKKKVGELQLLLETKEYLVKHGISLNDSERKTLIVSVAKTMKFLHNRQIIIGDFSSRNVLFSLLHNPKVFFLDCDSWKFRNMSFIPQAETPDWECTLSGTETATVNSDHQKLALLAIRLFAGDAQTRDPSKLGVKMTQWLDREILKVLRDG